MQNVVTIGFVALYHVLLGLVVDGWVDGWPGKITLHDNQVPTVWM